ncbi:hypothetical protein MPTK1_6g05710 [Marchantia polymorpha subsp. ruderalis]|uniref:Uncharacterized protein n=2 Tax=Marchantia polymorpha TaxID=3197 RepID=A0AAF6BNX9_MARPO|nr:hypothetical protein MARPO_0097s0071 [Marchantia polymorpha]BBN13713.1 hypothetical protein Mp_6g05710 [Marchantia polymorpha subsp. ruderalis]|eukprot:PTQ32597.1 hypothetical protein MARPO_0097s0071 [Marchantia polymorpha]
MSAMPRPMPLHMDRHGMWSHHYIAEHARAGSQPASGELSDENLPVHTMMRAELKDGRLSEARESCNKQTRNRFTRHEKVVQRERERDLGQRRCL